jgi:MFS family permease
MSAIPVRSSPGSNSWRWPPAVLFVLAGLSLPLLAAAVTPRFRGGPSYGDAASLLAARRDLAIFSSISALPFAVLALFTLFHLRGAGADLLRRRFAAILVTFAALFVLGWWCYAPRTEPGFNFAVVFFPIYAAIAGPIAYALGRAAASRVIR